MLLIGGWVSEPTRQEFVLKAGSLVLLGDATFNETLLLVAKA